MNLLIRAARVWQSDPDTPSDDPVDVRVTGDRVSEIGYNLPVGSDAVVAAPGSILFPGLINAHDHLEMNLYPRLGSRHYPDMYAWSDDIYKPDRSPISDIERIPLATRLLWGGYKNLLSGVTTVAHHNPWHRSLGSSHFPVKVLDRYRWSHSIGLSSDIERDFNRQNRTGLFFIHAAEGTSERTRREIGLLRDRGLLNGNTVLIHAVSATQRDIDTMARLGCKMVWCPSSNLFLYGLTAPVDRMLGRVPVALGTDATISGAPTLWDELRQAEATTMLDPDDLVELSTIGGARTLDLNEGQGRIIKGGPADLLLLPYRGSAARSLIDASPPDIELVLTAGVPGIASDDVATQLGLGGARWPLGDHTLWIRGKFERLVDRLTRQASKDILARNPLWRMLIEKGPFDTPARVPGAEKLAL